METDLPVGDEGLSLHGHGVAGCVIYTPGHTTGSISALLDAGGAFVGDLAASGLPSRLGPRLPPLAADAGLVRESWQRLLDLSVRPVYPGHGRPFPAEVIRRALR